MFSELFNTKSLPESVGLKIDSVPSRVDIPANASGTVDVSLGGWTFNDLFASPMVCGHNFMELFRNVPEVFFPIDYIASRVSGAKFQLKKVKDDSVVWENKRMNQILTRPNCLMSWKELIYQHFVYKLCTGSSFFRAAMTSISTSIPKHKMCDNYWVIPSDYVVVEPQRQQIPLFGIASVDEIVRCYRFGFGGVDNMEIPVSQIWHDRDGAISYHSGSGFLKAQSRLFPLVKPISNLIAVYEARNIIYVKRGGLGFLVSQKKDDAGTSALTKEEKKELLDDHYERYGLEKNKLPYGLSEVPLTFVRTNLSIAELQPFEETLADAIQIAGSYGIPSVLVPRKDQSTFNNQSSAEKSVYSSVIIPMASNFCADLTSFLGLEQSGYYLDCDFSHVDCLQEGLKEKEDVRTSVNDRCEKQFRCGLITINDWRAQIGESRFEEDIFDKTLFDMTDRERNRVKEVLSLNTKSGVEDGREDQVPSVQDEGE